MATKNQVNPSPVSPDLLEILRDPQAIQEGATYGADPGRLELTHGGYWLVSKDTGYKYPVRDGIPVMLVEEGARWKDTPVEALPVPPPAAEPIPTLSRASEAAPLVVNDGPDYRVLFALGALVLALLLIIGLGRKQSGGDQEPPSIQ